jgi:hypothetical protein
MLPVAVATLIASGLALAATRFLMKDALFTAWALLSARLLLISKRCRSNSLVVVALGLAALAAGALALDLAPAMRTDEALPGASNWRILAFLSLATAAFAAGRVLRTTCARIAHAAGHGFVFVGIALALDNDALRYLVGDRDPMTCYIALSVWGLCYGAALIAFGVLRARPAERVLGLFPIGLIGLNFYTGDVWQLDLASQAGAFVCLAVVALVVVRVFQKSERARSMYAFVFAQRGRSRSSATW